MSHWAASVGLKKNQPHWYMKHGKNSIIACHCERLSILTVAYIAENSAVHTGVTEQLAWLWLLHPVLIPYMSRVYLSALPTSLYCVLYAFAACGKEIHKSYARDHISNSIASNYVHDIFHATWVAELAIIKPQAVTLPSVVKSSWHLFP